MEESAMLYKFTFCIFTLYGKVKVQSDLQAKCLLTPVASHIARICADKACIMTKLLTDILQ